MPVTYAQSSRRRSSTASRPEILSNAEALRALRSGAFSGSTWDDEMPVDPYRAFLSALERGTSSLESLPHEQNAEVAPAREEADALDEQPEVTHSTSLPRSGLKRWAMRHLPMKWFSTSLVKRISGLPLRPKVYKGDKYVSSGSFRIKRITPQDAQAISKRYQDLANENIEYANQPTHDWPAETRENLQLSADVNEWLTGLAARAQETLDGAAQPTLNFYKLMRKGASSHDEAYAVAATSLDAAGGLRIEGVATNPMTLLSRLDPAEQSRLAAMPGYQAAQHNIRGVGTVTSILASIQAWRDAGSKARSVQTNAINPLSARIFERTTRGLNQT